MMNYIPEKAEEIIDEHIKIIESSLPNFLESYYIYGSISLGAFDSIFSDIDFIAVIKRKVNEEDINTLKKIHADMQNKYAEIPLEIRDKLLEPFIKYNSYKDISKEVSSSGLGLYLCSELAKENGWILSYEII
ncbi:ATP-binding protein, partial [Clostridium perfringens]|uniref:ATP-binding protein n=1 Tax=Clostridium perfringens TaxID=1502 RepID=UPI002ACBE773